MKRIITFFLLCTIFAACKKDIFIDQDSGRVKIENKSLDIHVQTPGSLKEILGGYEGCNIVDLKISGEVNGTDIKYLRYLAGALDSGVRKYGELKTLDMAEAHIKAGGEWYYQDSNENKYYSEDDVLSYFSFYNCHSLESVILPRITAMAHGCFSKCDALSSVQFGNDIIMSIPDYCFYGCGSLSVIELPSSVVKVGEAAFAYCYNLTNVEKMDNVEELGDFTFYECQDLKTVNLSAKLDSIPQCAFYCCANLEQIDLSHVRVIEDSAFYRTDKLKFVKFSDNLERIGDTAFAVDYLLPDGRGLSGNLILPKSLKYMGKNAFYQTNISTLEINSNIDTPNEYLWGNFYRCKNLREITVNEGVTKLYVNFSSCAALETVWLPESLEEIGYVKLYDDLVVSEHWGIFSGCANLRDVTLPKALKMISVGSFSGCKSIEYIELPEGVTTLCLSTFENCSALKSVSIPSTTKKIEGKVFKGCTKLDNIILPASITTLSYSVFEECSSLTSVTLPVELRELGISCFAGCTNLRDLYLGENLEVIGDNCFNGCVSLHNVRWGNALREIRESAFYHCPKLSLISLPQSIVEIGDNAFSLTGLTEVIVNWNTPLNVSETVFDKNLIGNAVLKVPEGTVGEYKQRLPWCNFGEIVEY
jgi:hypothetical protein